MGSYKNGSLYNIHTITYDIAITNNLQEMADT